MQFTLDSTIYRCEFHHQRDWTPPTRVLVVPKEDGREVVRLVYGRTECVISTVDETDCSLHLGMRHMAHARIKGEDGRTHVVFQREGQTVDAPPCTCRVEPVSTAWAYCSQNDSYDQRVGRKLAFTRALARFPRDTRAAFWKVFLSTVSQNVVIPTHQEHRKVMYA